MKFVSNNKSKSYIKAFSKRHSSSKIIIVPTGQNILPLLLHGLPGRVIHLHQSDFFVLRQGSPRSQVAYAVLELSKSPRVTSCLYLPNTGTCCHARASYMLGKHSTTQPKAGAQLLQKESAQKTVSYLSEVSPTHGC